MDFSCTVTRRYWRNFGLVLIHRAADLASVGCTDPQFRVKDSKLMKLLGSALTICFTLALTPFGFSATPHTEPAPNPDIFSTSNASLPDAPDAQAIQQARLGQPIHFGRNSNLRLHTDPFSFVAIGGTVGSGGAGFQIATPLMTKINLRVGASMLNYSPTLIEQGIPIEGAIRLRSANVGFDIFPYRGSFHITPGVTLYNGNRMTAKTAIVPGSSFTVNDNLYTSDITDPVHGSFDISLGGKIAPSFTMGWGNMLKRSKNWTMQTEFGIQYIGTPVFTLVMTGTVCEPNNPSNGCTSIQSDPSSLADLRQQQADINKAIQPLRFYPIITTIVAYRFGHKTATTFWR